MASELKQNAKGARLLLDPTRDAFEAVMQGAIERRSSAIHLLINPERLTQEGTLGKSLAWEDYYRQLGRKYQEAARYPWLPVSPDPPGPK